MVVQYLLIHSWSVVGLRFKEYSYSYKYIYSTLSFQLYRNFDDAQSSHTTPTYTIFLHPISCAWHHFCNFINKTLHGLWEFITLTPLFQRVNTIFKLVSEPPLKILDTLLTRNIEQDEDDKACKFYILYCTRSILYIGVS